MVLSYDPSRDRESKSRVRAGASRVSTIEPLENSLSVSGGDPGSIVGDHEAGPAGVGV